MTVLQTTPGMLFGRRDVLDERMAEVEDIFMGMIQGREVRDNVSRVIVFMTRLRVETFSIIYWRLVDSRVSDETGH